MMSIENWRKRLNSSHKTLREALDQGNSDKDIIGQFLALHGLLNSSKIAPEAPWSYEDILLDGLEEDRFRGIPEGQEHSVAWVVWHLSRIEDVTMNLLVDGKDQVFERGGWLKKTRSPITHTGNGTGVAVVKALSEEIDLAALRDYRYAVGRATQEIVLTLTNKDFRRKAAPSSLDRIMDEGAVVQAGIEVVEYWGRCDVAWLLLMPPTRHTIVHWNEARSLLHRLG